VRARVPASSANLGPGFDTLGVALTLYTEVSVTPSDRLHITTAGEGSGYPTTANHFTARLVRQCLGHDRVRIDVLSEIPVSRGLGSSASLAVAVVAACGHPDPLRFVALLEGHADNAAACVLGGFVTATIADGKVLATRLPLDAELSFVALVPDRALSTKEARGALAEHVPMIDAVANLGRMGALIAGFADHRRLGPAAFDDRLHQSARTPLYPESVPLLRALTDAGALGSCWSGAGPTLLAVCHWSTVHAVRKAGEDAMAEVGLDGRSLVLDTDTTGLIVSE
jgi:homoserine kinase